MLKPPDFSSRINYVLCVQISASSCSAWMRHRVVMNCQTNTSGLRIKLNEKKAEAACEAVAKAIPAGADTASQAAAETIPTPKGGAAPEVTEVVPEPWAEVISEEMESVSKPAVKAAVTPVISTAAKAVSPAARAVTPVSKAVIPEVKNATRASQAAT